MTIVPIQREINRFSRTYRGSFGRFQTDSSYSVQYLLTTLNLSDIGDLSTASEVLDMSQIQFDELIQRDIDRVRVRRIAEEYLLAGRNRPVFFPPLIACVALLDEPSGGRLKRQYDDVAHERQNDQGVDTLITTYDTDGFQVKLPVATATQSDRTIEWSGGTERFFDYAGELALNPQRTKLVVLDGQHRLEALRTLMQTAAGRKVIASVEIPVCIVWPPSARVGEGEEITSDFRDLFVTINSEPQRVSGHFLTLLNDIRYNAMTARELADSWKQETNEGAAHWCRLHLLEWNTRENERVDQRTRGSSITTISILAKELEQQLFGVSGLPSKMLNLASRAAELREAEPNLQYSEISDEAQTPSVNAIIRQQIQRELLPALKVLLRTLRPYAAQEQKLGAAFARQQQHVQTLHHGHAGLAQYLAAFAYSLEERAGAEVTDAYADFRSWAKVAESDTTYFLAAFQRGLIRMWLRVAAHLSAISASEAAKATVAALNVFAVQEASSRHAVYLAPDQLYCRRVLWKGDSVNFGPEWARRAWRDILIATLLRSDVREAALAVLPEEKKEEYDRSLMDLGLQAAREYTDRLWDETLRETRNNLGDYFGEIHAGQLRELKQTNLKDFERQVSDNAQERYSMALTQLANRLGRRNEDLVRPG